VNNNINITMKNLMKQIHEYMKQIHEHNSRISHEQKLQREIKDNRKLIIRWLQAYEVVDKTYDEIFEYEFSTADKIEKAAEVVINKKHMDHVKVGLLFNHKAVRRTFKGDVFSMSGEQLKDLLNRYVRAMKDENNSEDSLTEQFFKMHHLNVHTVEQIDDNRLYKTQKAGGVVRECWVRGRIIGIVLRDRINHIYNEKEGQLIIDVLRTALEYAKKNNIPVYIIDDRQQRVYMA